MTDHFDFDAAYRQLARVRGKRDTASRYQVQTADHIAGRITHLFGPEAQETAGLALILGASMLADLIGSGIHNPNVLANVLGLVGQRLTADARDIADAHKEPQP